MASSECPKIFINMLFTNYLLPGRQRSGMQLVMKRPVRQKVEPEAAPIPGRLVGYARVSTSDQRLDLQLDALGRAGVLPENIHKDFASGARVTRKGLTNALRDCREGDTLVVWKLDRLGRSLPDLINKMQELKGLGVGFRSLTEGIDTTTAMGTLVLHLMGAIAQFERDLTRERTAAGMRVARAKGIRLGAKPKLSDGQRERAEAMMRDQHMIVREVARRLKVSPTTIYNYFPGGRSALLSGAKT
jgi:DNA invertase Pin-like site-specific DNA recombinase